MTYFKHTTPILLVTGLFFFASCKGKKETSPGDNTKPVPVTTALPGGSVEAGIRVSGKIEAVQTAQISTRLMGTITRIYVKTGDPVRKGQVLAAISSQDILAKRAQTDAAIAEAEANVNNAQKDFERFTRLYNKQSASAKELDNVTLQYQAAKARLEAAGQMRNEVKALASYSSLTAPFDGVVTRRLADEGDMANPGVPLLVVEQSSALQVSATVSEDQISRLKKGLAARVGINATGQTMECQVTEISPSSLLTGGQYEIRLRIPEKEKKNLYAGMYVNVFIPVSQPAAGPPPVAALLVPAASLVQNEQLTGLYTISSNNTALLRWVRTGKTFGDQTEILSGLAAGEKFIVKAEGQLFNGVPVTEKK
ncbi:MAG: efflux RND transporter periplasmic adaptor subunit [Sphingobacteriales bacterium]|nr:efflux RND transporter periplasmic adaptor subunit [Sphingobacteriales bacterium]